MNRMDRSLISTSQTHLLVVSGERPDVTPAVCLDESGHVESSKGRHVGDGGRAKAKVIGGHCYLMDARFSPMIAVYCDGGRECSSLRRSMAGPAVGSRPLGSQPVQCLN